MATATSSDGFLTVTTDPTWAGVKLTANYTSAMTKPVRVQFLRGTTTVRSGDPAESPGGSGIAYDHEAPLGLASTWTVTPYYADGTTGAASAGATVTVEAMAATVDCWVKPLNNGGAAVSFALFTDSIKPGWQGRTQVTPVVGRRYPSGSWDNRTPAPMSLTARATSAAAKDAVEAALDLGPVLVQLGAGFGIADFYALPGDSEENFVAGEFNPLRDIPTSFIPIQRPATIDAPLIIPGKSWAALTATYGTWSAVASGNTSWATLNGY